MRLSALLLAAAAASAASSLSSDAYGVIVYGGGTETGSRYNPGAGVIAYMNCFTPLSDPAQSRLSLESVVVGIRRLTSSGALVDVGLNVYAAEMTATPLTAGGFQFGISENTLIYSTASIGSGSASLTQLVGTGPISSVVLDLETASNPGWGGWWIGVEFTGANASSTANGWRVVNAPTTGASINAFALFNNAGSGAFEAFFAFGNPPGSSPSRFLVNVDGTIVPGPGAIALLGLAGLVTRRRRG